MSYFNFREAYVYQIWQSGGFYCKPIIRSHKVIKQMKNVNKFIFKCPLASKLDRKVAYD